MPKVTSAVNGDRDTVKRLVQYALEAPGEARQAALQTLHSTGGNEALAEAVSLALSRDGQRRALAMDILGQLQVEGEAIVVVRESIEHGLTDASSNVAAAAAVAAGHRELREYLPDVLRMGSHTDSTRRLGAVIALGMLASASSQMVRDRVLDALVLATSDENAEVREWALFSLSLEFQHDQRTIEAMLRCTRDPAYAVRGEAILGLAEMGHPAARSAIARELEGQLKGSWVIEAAISFPSSKFLTRLRHLRSSIGPEEEWLRQLCDRAITACRSDDQV